MVCTRDRIPRRHFKKWAVLYVLTYKNWQNIEQNTKSKCSMLSLVLQNNYIQIHTHTHMLVCTLTGWARRNQLSVKLQWALSPTCLFSSSWRVCAKSPENLAAAHVIPLLVIHPEVLKNLSVHMGPKTYLSSRKVGNKYRGCWLCHLIILSSGQSTTEKRAAQKESPGDL